MRNFGSNIDLRKLDFLSQEKISDPCHVLTNVNNEDKIFQTFYSSQMSPIQPTVGGGEEVEQSFYVMYGLQKM